MTTKKGAFNQSNQKNKISFAFFFKSYKIRKIIEFNGQKKRKTIFPPLPAILMPEFLDLKKNLYVP